VRLWVDGELLVDNWKDQGAKERSGTVSLRAGRPVPIRMEYYEHGGGAVAELRWTPPGGSKALVPQAVLFTAAPSSPPPLAGGLQGAYFANPDLYADPVLERLDPEPQFDWGSGSPDPSIPDDDFSIRWVGRITAPVAGTYRFHTRTDDGTNLWIDGELVVDDWKDHGPTTRTSRAFTLAEGQVVQVVWEYYESGGGAVAELLWSYGGSPIHAMPTFALDPDIDPSIYLGTGTGLSARYFNNPHVDGEPDLERIDPAIDFRWGGSSPDPAINAEHFSVEWTGTIETQYSEDYTLEYAADDGVLIWIDGRLLIDEWHPNGGSIHSATFRGEAGKRFPIRVLHYEKTGNAQARLYWSSASRPRQLVPEDRLYPTEAAAPSLTIPASSPVSPAFVEGSVPAGRTGDLTITAGATDVTPHELTARSFFADLPLDPAAAQPISIGLPDGTPVTGSITWTPTPLDGGPAVVIRQDDRLLFPASPGSTLTVLTASGTYATQTVPAAGQAVFAFPDPGHYVVQDESLKERDVTVVGIDHTAPVACEVGYTRPLDVPLAPDTTDAVFGANDPSQLGVQTGAFDATTGLQALSLTPAKRGTPRLTARIGDDAGPVLWVREIDEFTIEITHIDGMFLLEGLGRGTGWILLRPHIPDLTFSFDMFASASTFTGGAVQLASDTSDLFDGQSGWVLEPDETADEDIGVLTLPIEMPANESKYCFRTTVLQANSPEIQVSLPKNANGEACRLRIKGGTFVIPETSDEDSANLAGTPRIQIEQQWAPVTGTIGIQERDDNDREYQLALFTERCNDDGATEEERRDWFAVNSAGGTPPAGHPAPCVAGGTSPSHCTIPDTEFFDPILVFQDSCSRHWPSPDICKKCSDDCILATVHTGIIAGTGQVNVLDCTAGRKVEFLRDILFLNRLDLDGYTGPDDVSTRDPANAVCLNVPDPVTWASRSGPFEAVGHPFQVTLTGPAKRKLRVLSRDLSKLRLSPHPRIEIGHASTVNQVWGECVEIAEDQLNDPRNCVHTGVVYAYAWATSPATMIEAQMHTDHLLCREGELVNTDDIEGPVEGVERWVVGDVETLCLVDLVVKPPMIISCSGSNTASEFTATTTPESCPPDEEVSWTLMNTPQNGIGRTAVVNPPAQVGEFDVQFSINENTDAVCATAKLFTISAEIQDIDKLPLGVPQSITVESLIPGNLDPDDFDFTARIRREGGG